MSANLSGEGDDSPPQDTSSSNGDFLNTFLRDATGVYTAISQQQIQQQNAASVQAAQLAATKAATPPAAVTPASSGLTTQMILLIGVGLVALIVLLKKI